MAIFTVRYDPYRSTMYTCMMIMMMMMIHAPSCARVSQRLNLFTLSFSVTCVCVCVCTIIDTLSQYRQYGWVTTAGCYGYGFVRKTRSLRDMWYGCGLSPMTSGFCLCDEVWIPTIHHTHLQKANDAEHASPELKLTLPITIATCASSVSLSLFVCVCVCVCTTLATPSL